MKYQVRNEPQGEYIHKGEIIHPNIYRYKSWVRYWPKGPVPNVDLIRSPWNDYRLVRKRTFDGCIWYHRNDVISCIILGINELYNIEVVRPPSGSGNFRHWARHPPTRKTLRGRLWMLVCTPFRNLYSTDQGNLLNLSTL